MKLRKSNSKYDLSVYNLKCPVCERVSKNNKCLADHIFHYYLNLNDEKHRKFSEYLRRKSKEEFLKKAKKICPICNKSILNHLAAHFNYAKDNIHKQFYKNQKKLVVEYFLEYNSSYEIENMNDIILDKKWIRRYLNKVLARKKFLDISKEIFSRKRKAYWNSFSEEERKRKMKPVYEAEWKNLTPEQRKNHPWVIAGRKASLESSIRGSRNQKYAFELLKTRVPNYNWIYNYAINEDWQIDIAAPEQKIFIEWDGKFHRVAVFGEKHLNNIKNKDYLKNGIVTNQLKGTMIRVNDGGRFDKKFVEEKVDQIIQLLSNKFENEVVRL